MAINEKLKFSWGHIIAFVAIIFISYVSFMGISYLTDGNFLWAGIGVAAIDFIIIVFFIGAQNMKGTDKKFNKRIVYERVLVLAAPFVFCAVMIPYAHFWTVFDRRVNIESTFSASIERTKDLFDSYKSYADIRIANYDMKLAKTESSKVSRENKVNALRLQLVSDNFDNLKNVALQWIDRASKATVWNIFMIGNIHKIKDALGSWNKQLTDMSQKIMSEEDRTTSPFTSEDPSVVQANQEISSLDEWYSTIATPNWRAVLTGIILLLMLLFPYFVQSRNTKNSYWLLGKKMNKGGITLEIPENPASKSKSEDGGYHSFTM